MSAIFLGMSGPATGPLQRVGVLCSVYHHSVLTHSVLTTKNGVFHLPKYYIRKKDFRTEKLIQIAYCTCSRDP